jgi:2-polyprenyl-6-methoxyphenol hydroxylase-like FAD-dependent oxidoreductase
MSPSSRVSPSFPLRDEGDRVVAVLESSAGTEEVTAGWVLGADGAGSVVRHATGLRLEGWEDGKYAVYADVDVEMDFPFDSTTMVTDARRQRSVRPMGGKRVRLAFPARQLDLSVVPTVDDVQALCDEMLNGRVRIVTPHWLLHYRAHRASPPASGSGGCCWRATPDTSTRLRAGRA